MLSQKVRLPSFLWLHNIPLCKYLNPESNASFPANMLYIPKEVMKVIELILYSLAQDQINCIK